MACCQHIVEEVWGVGVLGVGASTWTLPLWFGGPDACLSAMDDGPGW